MSAAKEAVRRAYQAYETGDLAVLDAVMAADYFDHNPIEGQGPGLGAKQKLAGTFEQLSGLRVKILRGCVRYSVRNHAPFCGRNCSVA